MAGKGDKPRPVNKKVYNNNFDIINWNKKNIEVKLPIKQYLGKKSFKY